MSVLLLGLVITQEIEGICGALDAEASVAETSTIVAPISRLPKVLVFQPVRERRDFSLHKFLVCYNVMEAFNRFKIHRGRDVWFFPFPSKRELEEETLVDTRMYLKL